MKSRPVVSLPEVEFDLQGAIAHYESWRSDGRAHILQKYDETVSWISWNPESFPKKYGEVQRAILKQSYYIVYFIQSNHFIHVENSKHYSLHRLLHFLDFLNLMPYTSIK